MKKFLSTLGVLALLGAPAFAITLSAGDFEMHLKDGTSLYDMNPQSPTFGLPRDSGFFQPARPGFASDVLAVGDESRTAFWVDAITQSGTVALPAGQLTGLVHDLYIDASSVQAGPILLLNYTNATASVGGPAPKVTFWLDPTPDNVDGVGGVTISDTFDPYNDQKAPTYWVPDGYAPGIDAFPNVNMAGGVNPVAEDAVLWLEVDLVPFMIDPITGAPVYVTTFMNTAVGSGASLDAFGKVVGGSFMTSIAKGVYMGGAADLTLQFTTSQNPNPDYTTVFPFAFEGGWALESSDPIQGAIVPEPATLTALGLGLAALFGYRRRK